MKRSGRLESRVFLLVQAGRPEALLLVPGGVQGRGRGLREEGERQPERHRGGPHGAEGHGVGGEEGGRGGRQRERAGAGGAAATTVRGDKGKEEEGGEGDSGAVPMDTGATGAKAAGGRRRARRGRGALHAPAGRPHVRGEPGGPGGRPPRGRQRPPPSGPSLAEVLGPGPSCLCSGTGTSGEARGVPPAGAQARGGDPSSRRLRSSSSSWRPSPRRCSGQLNLNAFGIPHSALTVADFLKSIRPCRPPRRARAERRTRAARRSAIERERCTSTYFSSFRNALQNAGCLYFSTCLFLLKTGRSVLLVWVAKKGAKTSSTAMSLMRMFRDGPEVSLSGSPTVSPMTAALWASVPFPPSDSGVLGPSGLGPWHCPRLLPCWTRRWRAGRQRWGSDEDSGKAGHSERVPMIRGVKMTRAPGGPISAREAW